MVSEVERKMTNKEVEIQLALGLLTHHQKFDLADNSNTLKKILTILSKDKYWRVRYYVAKNSNTPKEVLTELSKDKDGGVRYSAIKNLKRKKNGS